MMRCWADCVARVCAIRSRTTRVSKRNMNQTSEIQKKIAASVVEASLRYSLCCAISVEALQLVVVEAITCITPLRL